MGLENLLIILIGICSLIAVEGAVILVTVVRNGKRAAQPAAVPAPAVRSEPQVNAKNPLSGQAAAAVRATKREGFQICRSCYGIIPEHSRSCSACGASVNGGRY